MTFIMSRHSVIRTGTISRYAIKKHNLLLWTVQQFTTNGFYGLFVDGAELVNFGLGWYVQVPVPVKLPYYYKLSVGVPAWRGGAHFTLSRCSSGGQEGAQDLPRGHRGEQQHQNLRVIQCYLTSKKRFQCGGFVSCWYVPEYVGNCVVILVPV